MKHVSKKGKSECAQLCVCVNMLSRDREFMDAHIHTHTHTHAHCVTWPLSELSQLSGAFFLHPSVPPSLHLPTCSPLRACVCRHTLLGACLTFFPLHNTRRHRHTCSSSSWASIKKSTSLFFLFLSPFPAFFHSLPLPSF